MRGRAERGMVRAQFAKWDFHDDAPDYEAQLREWGWIKKEPTTAIVMDAFKRTWTQDRIEFYQGDRFGKPRNWEPLTKPGWFARVRAWIQSHT